MGYGFPAAIGAKLGRPDKVVFDISGDGSFQMNSQEMATIVQNDIPIIIALFNNGYLGMVRQWQALFFEHRYSHTTIEDSVDFVKLAEAYGAQGLKAMGYDEVPDAIEEALAYDGPSVIDFRVDPEENVYPMVPSGADNSRFALNEGHLEEI